MKLRVLSVAEREFADAVDYYNHQRAGLGSEFTAEVSATFERIQQFPSACAPFSATTRRCRVHRFPYGVLYYVEHDEIVVVAIMHLARDPRRWQDRIDHL